MSLFGLFKRAPKVQHSVFGELTYRDGCWRGSARFQPIQEKVRIKIKGDDTPPNEDVSDAFRNLEAEFDQIVPKLQHSIHQLIPGLADVLNDTDDSIMRQVSKDEVLAIVSLRQIQFESVSMKDVLETVLPSHTPDESADDEISVITQLWFVVDEAPGFVIREIVTHSAEEGWHVGGAAMAGEIG